MSEYKALFLDIDGTIVQTDKTIDASVKEAVKQVQQKGVHVFIATGRPIHDILHIGNELNIDSYIGYNGALVMVGEKILFSRTMEGEKVKAILEIAKEVDNEVILFTDKANLLSTPLE